MAATTSDAYEIVLTGLTNEQKYNTDIFYLNNTGISNRSSTYIQITPSDEGVNSHETILYSNNAPSISLNIIGNSGNASGSISWTAPENNDDIFGYLVWYHDTTYHLFTVVNNDVSQVNINNLNNGTTYSFAVSLYNMHGIGPISNIITITPTQPSYVPCLVTGTHILTQNGYKPIETLNREHDMIITSDGRCVSFNLFKWHLNKTDNKTAPYRISAHAFGKNNPSQDLLLSPLHAFLIDRKGIWQIPKYAALMNRKVRQELVGEPCDYYHIMLPNYYTDNLIIEGGNIVESFCGKRKNYNLTDIYKFNTKLGGFTRKNPCIFAVK